MTKPIPSYVEYKGHKYTILGFGLGPVDIFDVVGVEPNTFSTAGNFSVTYSVQQQRFLIKDIRLMHSVMKDELSNMPLVNGVRPIGEFYRDDDLKTDWVNYNKVGLFHPITGYVAIGRRIVSHYKSSMLPPLPRMYKVVIRLKVTNGYIDLIEDLSERAKSIRKAEIARDSVWIDLYKAIKITAGLSVKEEEHRDLFREERCIEDPNECDEL